MPLHHPTLVLAATLGGALSAAAQPVTTYHNNTLRTGWNDAETTLTVANVRSSFDLQATTTLDGQVDSQPLVMPNQTIDGVVHTVVYVATSNDTLYAIDATSGAILKRRHFGTPVPEAALPGQCNNNGPSIGISSTPVIDPATGTLYLIADTYENSTPAYHVHGISLTTLADTLQPVLVKASAALANGASYAFNPAVSRQRAALLLSGSTLYAGFTSYCDQSANVTRGWMLGWSASNLAPLPHNTLTDATPSAQSGTFLNTIWMSGYGPSSEGAKQPVYFLSSNSDKNTYGDANRDESAVKLSADLTHIQAYYTDPNHAAEDDGDQDLGAGGAMLLPQQPGKTPALMVGGGKNGALLLIDRASDPALMLLGSYGMGGCWCGPSAFGDADGAERVVTSGGSNVIVWRVNTSSTASATLAQQSSTAIDTGEDPGFFTSISSDARHLGTAIIWAVGRPTKVPGTMPLYAINADTGGVIYHTPNAGHWISGNSDADTVPTIANGHVYVATYKELAIFGLGSPAASQPRLAMQAAHPYTLATNEHAIWGTIRNVTQTELLLENRHGDLIRVYLPPARAAGNLAAPVIGQAAVAIGTRSADGLLMATHIEHAKSATALWPKDQ